MKTSFLFTVILFAMASLVSSTAFAQLVCLPAPRLLTTMPMGGQAGTTLEVTITGDYIENAGELCFSHSGITAKQKLDDGGKPVPNCYVVSISADCPTGIHEARVMSRLGVSTSRVFNVSSMSESSQAGPNMTLKTAMPLKVNSICNSVMTNRAVDHYLFEAKKGQRIVVDCAARGIDSKLKPVLIVADSKGADLKVERRGGVIDFTAPADGQYVLKLHDLTFNGGSQFFYRLALTEAAPGQVVARLPSVKRVSSCSWPIPGLTDDAIVAEKEPNNRHAEAEKLTLPADIKGSFFPAADVDTFEFTAKKGEVWWVEVASERLGRPTDPSIVVQHVSSEGDAEKLTDIAELSDISSPVKTSSNGYSYDGPPYNAGSTDIIGKFQIQQDGKHRLQLRDLFGGTRNDPTNEYRLIIRKASPDFALAGWAMHMGLRNGDRAAFSKPIALRGGHTMPIEVVVISRDGFGESIELVVEGLPDGVTATGLKIPAGQSRGIVLITADQNAPRGLSTARIYGRSTVSEKVVTRECRLASMQWPVRDASQEIPSPRLLADIPVSVCGSEFFPITIGPLEDKVWEVTAGQKLKLPLIHTRRGEFSGSIISLKTFGNGFDRNPAFEAPLDADSSEATLDLAALKTPPGEYEIAFYGSAVAKYRYNIEAVELAKATLKQAQEEAARLAAEAQTESGPSAADAAAKQKAAEAAVTAAQNQLKAATAAAQPKDIVDIVVSKPIRIRVNPVK
jgi:hypothetical protein